MEKKLHSFVKAVGCLSCLVQLHWIKCVCITWSREDCACCGLLWELWVMRGKNFAQRVVQAQLTINFSKNCRYCVYFIDLTTTILSKLSIRIQQWSRSWENLDSGSNYRYFKEKLTMDIFQMQVGWLFRDFFILLKRRFFKIILIFNNICIFGTTPIDCVINFFPKNRQSGLNF